MAAGRTYTPIATQTLGSDSNFITFNSIPQTYTDLILVCNIRSTTAGNASDNYIRLATGGGSVDTGTNYSATRLYGDGSTAGSNRQSSQTQILAGSAVATNGSTGNFSTVVIQIMNYSNSTTYKTCITRGSSPDTSFGYATADVGLWRNTGAITSVQSLINGNYKAGSTFTLYGIAAA